MEFTLTGLWGHMGLFARLVVVVLAFMSLSSVVVMANNVGCVCSANKVAANDGGAAAGAGMATLLLQQEEERHANH